MALEKVSIVSMDDPWKRGGAGGKTTHLRLLMKGLSSSGVSPELVCAKETPFFRFKRNISGLLVRNRMDDRERRYEHYMAQASTQLDRYLEKAAMDSQVVNAHDVLAANRAFAELARRGGSTPLVLTLHGYFTREASSNHELNEGSPSFERFIGLERDVYRRATRIVCVDSRIKEYVVGLASVPDDRLTVIPNAVDSETFKPPSAREMADSRRALGLRPEETVVLCPRRLVVKNGIEFAVRGVATLVKESVRVRLILAGDGPERKNIERLTRELSVQEKVLMAGTVPHERIAKFYAASDIVLIPSVSSVGVQEATSLSMLEGMASSLPVVVTGIGGLKETVKDGETGLVVKESDPDAIASAIKSLSGDKVLAARLGTSAREYVIRHHSHLAHAKAMIGEYEKALARPGP